VWMKDASNKCLVPEHNGNGAQLVVSDCSEDVAARRRAGFEQVWDLAVGACWHAAHNHAGFEQDSMKDLENRNLALISMKSYFQGNSQLENFAESMTNAAQDYGWHANNALRGNDDEAEADHAKFEAQRSNARTSLNHDDLFWSLEGMVREYCWSAAHSHFWDEDHSEVPALHLAMDHWNDVTNILNGISAARAWPLYSGQGFAVSAAR